MCHVATSEHATLCGGVGSRRRSQSGSGRDTDRWLQKATGQTDRWASAYWTGPHVFGLQTGLVGSWVWSQVGLAEPLATRLD